MTYVFQTGKNLLDYRRMAMFGVVAMAYLVLYAASQQLGGNASMLGLSDDTIRTIGHFSIYGTLAVVLAKAMRNQYLLAWLVTSLLATGEEFNQLFVPFRSASIEDWATNLIGITFFLLLTWVLSSQHAGDTASRHVVAD